MLHIVPAVERTAAVLAKNSIRCTSSSVSASGIWSSSISFASPESDFTADKIKNKFLDHLEKNEHEKSRLIYSLSFAHPESDYTSLLLTEDMKEQLANVKSLSNTVDNNDNNNESLATTASNPLIPTTLYEALQPSDEARVITELSPPFHISNVNKAWEQLCGYTQDECYGKTLSMIQGIETDKTAITALMNQLVGRGETAGIVLTNYKKDGKKFRNRLTVGPLYGDIDGRNSHKITHLIGILQEISDSNLGTEKQSMRI